ncbi:hypothetical protein [Streptomyces sp. JNUCC 63]
MAVAVLTAAVGAGVVALRVWQGRARRVRRPRDRDFGPPVDTSWFTDQTLNDFPDEVVRACLKDRAAPSMDRVYTAWILAVHGADAAWLERHLDLPADLARPLVEAAVQARRRRVGV